MWKSRGKVNETHSFADDHQNNKTWEAEFSS